MLAWDIVTQKIEMEWKIARINSMIENVPNNVLFCDIENFNIVYANKTSLKTLESLEKYIPIKASELIGANIDVFHKNPAHQRRLLSNDKNLPHRAIISVGPEKLSLIASAVYDQNKKGILVPW
jgi:methyl-accepting chemotaxis protein